MKAIMRDKAELRDSGIEWIGDIPENWTLSKIKYHISGYKAGPFGSSLITSKLDHDGELLVYTPEHVAKKSTNIDGNLYLPINRKEEMSQFLVSSGDVVFPIVGSLGRAMQIEDNMPNGIINQRLAKFCISESNIIPSYFMWLFGKSTFYETYIELFSRGSIIVNLTKQIVGNMPLPLPSVIEQQDIINYLDDRCSKIDTIIAEAKASIEEYKELKISMVNDAVTHGIKDNADIDSDIDWIGKIPANWRIMIMKRLFKIRKDIAGKEGYTVLSITQRGIVPKNFKENGQFAADYSNYQLVNRGDFAMNHMDLLTGWVDISEYDGVTSPDYRVFVPTGYEEIYKPYYKYVMQNCYSCKIFYGLGHGVSGFGRWRLPKDMFLNFKVPLPPIEEQKEIASYIDNNLQKLDALISTKQSLIEDLESYQKSLIYEVVTGKRKVVD